MGEQPVDGGASLIHRLSDAGLLTKSGKEVDRDGGTSGGWHATEVRRRRDAPMRTPLG